MALVFRRKCAKIFSPSDVNEQKFKSVMPPYRSVAGVRQVYAGVQKALRPYCCKSKKESDMLLGENPFVVKTDIFCDFFATFRRVLSGFHKFKAAFFCKVTSLSDMRKNTVEMRMGVGSGDEN